MTGHDHESDEDKAESLEMAVLKEDPQRCSRLGRSPHLSVPRPIILLQWMAKLKISLRKVNVMTYFHLHMHEKQINLGMRFGTTNILVRTASSARLVESGGQPNKSMSLICR